MSSPLEDQIIFCRQMLTAGKTKKSLGFIYQQCWKLETFSTNRWRRIYSEYAESQDLIFEQIFKIAFKWDPLLTICIDYYYY